MFILNADSLFLITLWLFSLFGVAAGPKASAICAADVDRFCPETASGQPMAACLSAHGDEVSAGCAAVLEFFISPGPCPTELRGRLCPEAPNPGTRNLLCMKRHSKDLPAACRSFVTESVEKRACLEDIGRFCPDTGPLRERTCLAEHAAELSPACRKRFESARQQDACSGAGASSAACRRQKLMRSAAEACLEDSKKLCEDFPTALGRFSCLGGRLPEVSTACRRKLKRMPCLPDWGRFCSDAKGDEVTTCLKRNAEKLAPACRERLR